MDKKLPSVFANKIAKDINNNEKVTLIKNKIQEIQKQHNDASCMYILLNILC